MSEPHAAEPRRLPAGARDLDAKLVAALERVGQALRGEQWARSREHGLNPAQLQVLLRLAVDDPARRRVGVLADELGVSQPAMSDTVAALRRKGLVERAPDPDQGTAWTLTLSARGRAVAGQLEIWDERVRPALAGLASEDKERALRLLLDLIAGLQAQGVVTVARMCVTCRFFRPHAHPAEAAPHHCALLDAPLAGEDLRVDCPEHEQAA